MALLDTGTTLTITGSGGLGLAYYSARGMRCRFEPIDAAKSLRRDINGNLMDLSRSEFKKYKVTLSATDQEPPDFFAEAVGQQVTVEPENGLPRTSLTMVVAGFNMEFDEWQAAWAWQLELEEA